MIIVRNLAMSSYRRLDNSVRDNKTVSSILILPQSLLWSLLKRNKYSEETVYILLKARTIDRVLK